MAFGRNTEIKFYTLVKEKNIFLSNCCPISTQYKYIKNNKNRNKVKST